MKIQTLLIVVLIGAAVIIGFWRDNTEPRLDLTSGTALTEPLSLPEFALVDMNNNPFTKDSLRNKWSFLFFGYSNCPEICPNTLAQMKQIAQTLRHPHAQYIFVSIDPENDTTPRLAAFLQQDKFKEAHIIGLTGNPSTIIHLASAIGVHVAKDKDASQNAGHIEHGGAILLINPEGKLAAVFGTTNKPHAIAHDFKEIVHFYANYG
jgi:protein SCO1/2